ncbi:TonB-dependent receptor [Myxococcaceae bacterium GXIMD 01537]
MNTALVRTTLLALVALAAVPARAEEPELLHSAPSQAEAHRPLRLDGSLIGGDRITELTLRYRGPGEPYIEAPMARQYGDLYRGSIPGEHMVPPGIEYYVEGVTKGGQRVAVFRSAARPARVTVAGEAPAGSSWAGTSTSTPAPAAPPPGKASASSNSSAASGSAPMAAFDEPPPAAVKPSSSRRKPSEPAPAPAPAAPTPRQQPRQDDAMAALSAEVPAEQPAPQPTRSPLRSPSSPSSDAPPPTRSAAEPAAPARSALEEDLALYSAEDTLALATRHEEKVTKVPAIAASFGREQIRAVGARTVADVLDVVPGLTVSRDVQGFHRVSVRGLRNEAEVLFLLNGHRLNNLYDGRALMNLPVENLDRVEVIRGPGSALYGAGAFLAVVNIVTDRSEGVRAAIAGGGFPELDDRLAVTADAHLSAAQSFGSVKVFGDVDVWEQAGDSSLIEKDSLDSETLNQGLREQGQAAGRTHDERFLLNAGLGMEWDGGTAGKLSLSARYLTENRGALVGLFDTVGEDSKLRWNVLMADLTYELPVGDNVLLRLRAFGDQQKTDRLFQVAPKGFRTGESAAQAFPDGMLEQTLITVTSMGGSVDADVTLHPTNRLSLGAVVEQQSLSDYAYATNYSLDNKLKPSLTAPEGLVNPVDLAGGAAANRMTLGFFAQDQWTVVAPLTLTFGFRVDATELPTVDANGAITGTELVPSFNPRVGLVLSATDSLVLKALYGRAFRSPTLQELVETIPNTDFNQGRFVGNPELRPATVDTFEFGADLVQAAGESRVRLRANVFYEQFASPIVSVDTSGGIVPVVNRELGVRVYGVEGEARLEASRRAVAWVNASLFRAEDMELPSQSRLLTDTPQARFNAGVSMPIGEWLNFDVVVHAGAERRNNSRSVLELIRRYKIPAYSLITAQFRTEPIFGHFEVAAVAHNLFDHDLRDDVPRPDRVPGLLPREGMSGYITVRARY